MLPTYLSCKTLSLLLPCALGIQRVVIVNELRLGQSMLLSFGLDNHTSNGMQYTVYVQGRLAKKELVWRTLSGCVSTCLAF